MPKAAQANNHVDKKRNAIPRNNLVPIAIRTEAPVNEEINGQSNSGAAAVAGTAGAGVQRWTFDEVSTLLKCYAIYEPRFSKKIERTATLWEKVNKEMEKGGVKTTAERCSVEFAAMKKRFNELNDQNFDGEKSRRVQWPFFSKMNELLGLLDASTLKHVHGVGADSSKKRDDDSNPSTPAPPKKRCFFRNERNTSVRRGRLMAEHIEEDEL
uniref:Myb/SANT-like DNA-binding domain-containing protein n=1 Tax=Daphnia galeata TaxID=27404 RepID=A0A8J2WEI6_9CRUS|nr:unnamed protein product [Daphnia galeata]